MIMIQKEFNVGAFFTILMTMILLSGCSGPISDPSKLIIKACGNSDLNPDVNGSSSPVDVLVFQLKEPHLFEEQDFLTLYQNAKKVLADDMRDHTRFVVQPGNCSKKEIAYDPLTKFVGIVVAFRDIDKAQTKQVFQREKISDTGLQLKLYKNHFVEMKNQVLDSDQKLIVRS